VEGQKVLSRLLADSYFVGPKAKRDTFFHLIFCSRAKNIRVFGTRKKLGERKFYFFLSNK
jgi:hypothetical protein